MATEHYYLRAIDKVVSSGFAKAELELTQRAASQAGSPGSKAREVLSRAKDQHEKRARQAGGPCSSAREMLTYMKWQA
jgi:hypothetical protein